MFLSISTQAAASDLSDVGIGPHCRSRLAPVLCAIKVQHARTNRWRKLAGSAPLRLRTSIYSAGRVHRIYVLYRWRERRVHARAYFHMLWNWAQAPARWCVHVHESVRWHYHGAHDGGYQYLVDTWLRAGGGQYAARADLATATEQIRVTRNYTSLHGWSEWSTAAECGL